MRAKVFLSTALLICFMAASGRADFKYTQSSQITGGSMAGVIHAMGMFSKRLREPAQSTTYVKDDFLRTDEADGSYQIIDVKGRRVIHVIPKKHAYSVMTFDEMREAMEKMQARLNQEMKRESKEKGSNITVTPKFQLTPSRRTQKLLGETAHEVKIKIDMDIQSQSARQGPQNATLATDIDSWVAPSVRGYEEVAAVYKKMALAMNWNPSPSFGMNPRLGRSMVELYKSGKIPRGLPMLQVVSLEGAAPAGVQGASSGQPSASSGTAATPGEAAAKALGGMFGGFGGFGHKKKKKKEEPKQAAQSSGPPSLMEITSRVTSFSSGPVDSSLFAVPAGYKLVKSPLQKDLEKSH